LADRGQGGIPFNTRCQGRHHLNVTHGKAVRMFREGSYRGEIGIVRVDYDTSKWTPKASYQWYKDVIERNGLIY
jgi:beta-glucosidase/6-phospho-beta-glucosidase/beta-galactosidase